MHDDTSIGGHKDRFPETRLSVIASARDGDDDTRRRARDAVIAGYWKPVYKYIRIKWNASNEDAKDLTQGFFTETLESPFFERFDAGRAKFRTYLRLCLDGYLSNEKKAAGRQKRGGGADHLPLDFESAEGELCEIEIPDTADPESVFRDEWIRSLFARAIGDLRDWCAANEKDAHFKVFEAYDLGSSQARPSYAELAETMNIPVTQVTNFLALARRKFRQLLLERIRELSGSEQEFHDEVRDILGVVPK